MDMQVDAARKGVRVRVRRITRAGVSRLRLTVMRSTRVLRTVWQFIAPPSLDGAPVDVARLVAGGTVTSHEAERLAALRVRLHGRPENVEFELSERRLQFARWLVGHGRLTEFPDGTAGVPVGGRLTEKHASAATDSHHTLPCSWGGCGTYAVP